MSSFSRVSDEQVVASLLAWPHTGFGTHVSREIPSDPVSRENVARYLAHPPIILDRILGDPPPSPGQIRMFDPLPLLAEMSAHIPDPHEKAALYYGWYSNRTRGFRRARGLLAAVGLDVPVPEADRTPLALRQTWARLIRKIYAVDPLRCPRCSATTPMAWSSPSSKMRRSSTGSWPTLRPAGLAPGDGPLG